MKKIIAVVITLVTISCTAVAQHIKDENFQKWIRSKYPEAIDKKGNLVKEGAAKVTKISCIEGDKIGSDLEGIESFTNLHELSIEYIQSPLTISKLPSSLLKLSIRGTFNLNGLPGLPQSLQELVCTQDNLTSLPLLPVSLHHLDCTGNKLSVLPVLPVSLTKLRCKDNPLSSLPKLPDNLEELDIQFTNISNLPVLPATLTLLIYSGNVDLGCLSAPNPALEVDKNSASNPDETLVMTKVKIPVCPVAAVPSVGASAAYDKEWIKTILKGQPDCFINIKGTLTDKSDDITYYETSLKFPEDVHLSQLIIYPDSKSRRKCELNLILKSSEISENKRLFNSLKDAFSGSLKELNIKFTPVLKNSDKGEDTFKVYFEGADIEYDDADIKIDCTKSTNSEDPALYYTAIKFYTLKKQ